MLFLIEVKAFTRYFFDDCSQYTIVQVTIFEKFPRLLALGCKMATIDIEFPRWLEEFLPLIQPVSIISRAGMM